MGLCLGLVTVDCGDNMRPARRDPNPGWHILIRADGPEALETLRVLQSLPSWVSLKADHVSKAGDAVKLFSQLDCMIRHSYAI